MREIELAFPLISLPNVLLCCYNMGMGSVGAVVLTIIAIALNCQNSQESISHIPSREKWERGENSQ